MARSEVELKQLTKYITDNHGILAENHALFDIYQGQLLPYIEAALDKMLTLSSLEIAKQRIAPINTLKRIIDKLSKIYSKQPRRRALVNGEPSERDQALLDWYCKEMKCDIYWSTANELFNLHKCVFVEPFVSNGKPGMRAVPADRFLVRSTDPIDPTRPTEYIKIMPSQDPRSAKFKNNYYVYTADEFTPINSDGKIMADVLQAVGNPEGINPFGAIPGVYINRDLYSVFPKPDSDMLRMSVLLAVMLGDINTAVAFQAFSIIFAIDVNAENLQMSPNTFWNLKSDKLGDKKPEVGTIKPTVDITEVQNLIMTELAFWLNTKNIRPGSVGDASVEQFASGISKMIDEMDTSEDRQIQTQFFKQGEEDFWTFIAYKAHPFWVRNKLINQSALFTPGVEFVVEFPEQLPFAKRAEVLKDVIQEMKEGLTTKKRALKRLEPDMTEAEIESLLLEVEEESVIQVEEAPTETAEMPIMQSEQMNGEDNEQNQDSIQ